ncbi:MAG TPA: hypothetical protein VGO57_17230 [Verrucomicrobiae bacterium]|jgi:hypothetical protein
MKAIYFKFKGGQPRDVFNTPVGHFAIGSKFPDGEGDLLISPECRTIGELRGRADYLKKLIDEAVLSAEVHLPA